jgi:hypothetical protein
MQEGTASRVMAADRPYDEFYDFYSLSPEYFGYLHVHTFTYRRLLMSNSFNSQALWELLRPLYWLSKVMVESVEVSVRPFLCLISKTGQWIWMTFGTWTLGCLRI